jgi:hypothetical protein
MLAGANSNPHDVAVDGRLRLCSAAKLAVGLAAVALPFARSHAEEAERWLRILRMNGLVGQAMQALGVPEHPIVVEAAASAAEPCQAGSFDTVTASARARAHERDAEAITTEDLLFGVRMAYGEAFEHALAIRATSSEELLDCIERRRESQREPAGR